MKFLVLFLIGTVLISLCTQPTTEDKLKVQNLCINACKSALNAGQNLENGPCLLNPITETPDWVCDVAHSPRQAIDNLQENQCQAFREGKAHHFVEVDTSCNLIRAV